MQKEKRLVLIIFECRIPQQLKRFHSRSHNIAAPYEIDNDISAKFGQPLNLSATFSSVRNKTATTIET